MAITQCIECDEDIEVDYHARLGQHLVCEHCGIELEIVSVDPLEVEVAQVGAYDGLWREESTGYGDLDDELLEKGLEPLEDELEEDDELEEEIIEDDELEDDNLEDDFDAGELDDDELDDEFDEFDFDFDDDDFDFDDDEEFDFDDEVDDRW